MSPSPLELNSTTDYHTPIAGNSSLEQLPAEILQNIFDLLYVEAQSRQSHLLTPLCNHLLPFSNRSLYRTISVWNDPNFTQLAASVSNKPSLAGLIISLKMLGFDDGIEEEEEEELGIDPDLISKFLLSLSKLRMLEVRHWHLAGAVLLSASYSELGGTELEKIKIENSFRTIPGPLSVAINHLRHLSNLISFVYENSTPPIEEPIDFRNWINWIRQASSFPALVGLELMHLHPTIPPEFAVFLAAIQPPSLSVITLSCSPEATYPLTANIHPIHTVLSKFSSLDQLLFQNRSLCTEELVYTICSLNKLSYIHFGEEFKISFELLQLLLAEIKRKELTTRPAVDVQLNMQFGRIGISARERGTPFFRNGDLVPGHDWRRPSWDNGIMTLKQAQALDYFVDQNEVSLLGSIPDALDIEEAFQEEELRLQKTMEFMRSEM